MEREFLELVRRRADQRILFLPHAVTQMNHPERMISTREVRNVVCKGEHYPEDPRGQSCLMLGKGENNRPVHVVCSPKDEYLAIITAYLPHPDQWLNDYRTRKQR